MEEHRKLDISSGEAKNRKRNGPDDITVETKTTNTRLLVAGLMRH